MSHLAEDILCRQVAARPFAGQKRSFSRQRRSLAGVGITSNLHRYTWGTTIFDRGRLACTGPANPSSPDENGDIFLTYESFGRGAEYAIAPYVFLDGRTPKGRKEPERGDMTEWARHMTATMCPGTSTRSGSS